MSDEADVDEVVVSGDDAGKVKARRRPVRAASLRLDETVDHFGSVVVDPERIAAFIGRKENDDERFIRDLIATSERHGKYVTLPVGNIGRVKAQATARKWQKPHKIDGETIRLEAVAFPRTDSGSRNWWTVVVKYDPATQVETTVNEPAAPAPEPTVYEGSYQSSGEPMQYPGGGYQQGFENV